MTYQNIKIKTVETKNSTVRVARNIAEFIQAAGLVIVATFSGYAVKVGIIDGIASYVIAVSASVIAVRGMYELLRSFNK